MVDSTLLKQGVFDLSTRQFVQAVADSIGLTVFAHDDGSLELKLASIESPEASQAQVLLLRTFSDLTQLWALQRETACGAAETSPAKDPTQIALFAAEILRPYHVRDGRVQMAGCTMEPRAILRISSLERSTSTIVHQWFDRDGSHLTSDLQRELGLDQLVVAERKLREGDRASVTEWIDAATNGIDPSTLVGAAIAWCRWVNGKVRFQFDNGRYDFVEFEGWAAKWVAGEIESPKFRCPRSHLESFNIVCLEDGTVTVQEAVGKCEQSGEEAFCETLQECAVSGKRVLASLLTMCPISRERFLPELAEKCSWCDREISPSRMLSGVCEQCRQLQPIDTDHHAIEQLRKSQPQYDRIHRWQGWVSDDLALLVGRRMLNEVMIVMRVHDGHIVRVAQKSRFSKSWKFDRHNAPSLV